MAKVIAISGPQGSGKSTLLEGLKPHSIHVDDFKVSRAVQASFGAVSLEEMTNDPDKMMKFQDRILTQKLARDMGLAARTERYAMTERSFADIYVYARLWSNKLIDNGKWDQDGAEVFLKPFLEECKEYQSTYASIIYVPSMTGIVWEDDPQRAKEEDVNVVAEDLEIFFLVDQPPDVPVYRVLEGSVSARIDETLRWIRTL